MGCAGRLAAATGLAVANPFVRLRPLNDAGFIIHNTKGNLRRDITQLERNVNRDDDALWCLTLGLADAKGISFESARMPGWYLRDKEGVVVFAKDDGTPEFKREVTWQRKVGLAGAGAYSYESPDHSGEYLRLGRPMVRKPANSEQDRIDATFFEMR